MSQPQLLATDLVIGESARWHDGCRWLSNWAPKRFSRTTWRASRSHDAGAYNYPVLHRLVARRSATGGGRPGAADANDRIWSFMIFSFVLLIYVSVPP
jgi:hypothetical protein